MIKINSFEVENIKRVKAVRMQPVENGLTVIGGRNEQGKTSVLDAIAWALGGDKFRPTEPYREGSAVPPELHVRLSNGLIVERKGKNGSLKVIDANGNKGGQQLLNEFIDQLALNLPKFMASSNHEKADTLLKIIGVGDQLHELDTQEQQLYNRRTEIGRIADQKKKYAAELVSYPDAPKEPVSATELIQQQQAILAKNGENQKKREQKDKCDAKVASLDQKIAAAKKVLADLQMEMDQAVLDQQVAAKSAEQLRDESTAELEASLANIEAINVKVRSNAAKEAAEIDAEGYGKQYDDLTGEINDIRKQRTDLLNNADLPLPELSVRDGVLTYKGFAWDNMSGSAQLKVATAIVRKLNPQCGFVLVDKLEQMDTDTLAEFGQWAESQGLQIIATRVSTGPECSIIIQDGYVAQPEAKPVAKQWKAGEF